MKLLIQTHWVPLLTLLLACSAWFPAVYGADLGDLFQVKKGKDKGGTDGKTDIMQKWLDDTVTLVDFVLPKLQGDPSQVDGTDRAMVRNLKSWFDIRLRSKNGIHPDDTEAYSALRTRFTKLDGFLKKQDASWNKDDNKPWLFYNSDWQEETELYYDSDGNAIDKDGDVMMSGASSSSQANLRDFNPPNLDQMMDSDKQFFADMKEKDGADWKFVAYWSSDIKDYELADSGKRYSQGGFCVMTNPGDHFFALTIDKLLVDSVTICPDAFTNNAEKFETIAEGMASTDATSDTGGKPLQDTSPRSLTLFHELIHLTSGADDTPDKGTKPTQCLELVKDNKASEAQANPDSIVFFAWSYYLEMKGTPSYRWNTGKKVKS